MSGAPPFIAVAGCIAAGKSTLMEALGRALGLRIFPERWEENPWFGHHQQNKLPSQLWFLTSAGVDHAKIASGGGGIQERCIHEHALVFASELLAGDDAGLADKTYKLLDSLLPNPQLLVFLDASPETLRARIRQRSRPEEIDVEIVYLRRLHARYRDFIRTWERCPVVSVDTEDLDLRVPKNIESIAGVIWEALQ